MLRSLLVSLVLVCACSTGGPPTASPAPPTGVPTSAPSEAPTAAPTSAPTTAPTPAVTAYCNPDYYDCDRYTPSPPATAGPGGGTVTIAASSDGYLVDPAGLSLYVFDEDSVGVSNCNRGCAGLWPPLTVAADQSIAGGDGVSGTFATITRDDGSLQVTYNDRPLYNYSGDSAPGHVRGDGIGNVWHLATP